MTDFSFNSEKMDEAEVVSEFSMEDYEKYRLKTGDITVDLAIVDLEDREADEYIRQRKNEIADSDTEVPHPYKPEKQSKDNGREKVDFGDREGEGYADPEYNLVSEESDGIVRYRYRVVWIEYPEKNILCEIEFYTSRGSDIDVESIAESLELG